ncbi:chromodomain-helicase-DNA-binding protein 1-like isoform X2 [Montipora foliosa]|uniref:chromodomain-helicase-DNA-binding protein 1-like isoform X2 n=1 Tax=Montipora foliosa TaxID=591990 RepID=UPI0035F13C16
MRRCFRNGHGCILGDEMGLGKTVQTVALLTNLQGSENCPGPFLIICPLSVLQNWESEFSRFSKHLNVILFIGDKDQREKLKESLRNFINSQRRGDKTIILSFNVLLTTYEMCLRETAFLSKFHWKAMVVDEAHRLKNSKSLLYQELAQFQKDFVVLLTGTPIQNNLKELYSLLSFISPNIFSLDAEEEFLERYKDVFNFTERNVELQKLLSPFLLRRVKSEVMAHLPKKTEVLLYTGMSDLQKKYYKAILMKDLDAFDSPVGTSKTRLLNILIQLRKCVNHPYLFDGVEPEPFHLGEHLINASGKLQAIDQLLIFLKERGHKVLMFSQMTRMLDIIQDYLGYRGYSYERLDGSVRGEERYLAIQNFNEAEDTFIFLLSTRAGGQGLNLMSADTVIFVDSDFNPQNDMQAAARAHRIGQRRPVKIIRLVTRSTVEEIILKRADEKLKLTNTVIEGGKFSGGASAVNQIAETPTQLADLLKFGLDKLFGSEESSLTEKDLERILGGSCNNEWIVEEETDERIGDNDDDDDDVTSCIQTNDENVSNMYVYEGRDYSKETSVTDQQAFDNMVADLLNKVQSEERLLRGNERKSTATQFVDLPTRKRKVFTPEELEERRRKREENAAKRAKLKEEEEFRRENERQRKLEKLWKENNYLSLNSALDDDEENVDEESDVFDEGDDIQRKDIQYVRGDVTHPINTRGSDAIIVHCVDDSGWWGQGGLFSALSRRSLQPENQYKLASEMKDLKLGDAHLVSVDDQERRKDGHDYVALIVAQSRDRKNQLSGILLTSLSQALMRVSSAAKKLKATVHLPRIGYNTPSFNWYGTERLIRKHLASKGIETSIYYYAKRQQLTSGTFNSPGVPSTSNGEDSTSIKKIKYVSKSKNLEEDITSCDDQRHNLPNFMRGVNVFFYNVDEDEKRKLRRYLVAYDGDVSPFPCHDVTHVVCANNDDAKLSTQELMAAVKIVSLKWLVNCFKRGRKLVTKPYEIQRTDS